MLVENVGATSCNPAVGGLAKGHLVRELDALGGEMGLITDEAGIQFRILNQTKGPAVRGSRAQIDMDKYKIIARNTLLNTKNLNIAQETAESLIIEDNAIKGVKTDLLNKYMAKKVIITSGTFLNGIIHIGEVQKKSWSLW
jgi:tRNA uridine 5-carboxymethylaminomethyl modification enzyme